MNPKKETLEKTLTNVNRAVSQSVVVGKSQTTLTDAPHIVNRHVDIAVHKKDSLVLHFRQWLKR
jgi:hypothetical protein